MLATVHHPIPAPVEPSTVTITLTLDQAQILRSFIGYNCVGAVTRFTLTDFGKADNEKMSAVNSAIYYALRNANITPSLQRAKVPF